MADYPVDALEITDAHFLDVVNGVCMAWQMAAAGLGDAYKAALSASTARHRALHRILCKHARDTYDLATERYIAVGKLAIQHFARNEEHAQRLYADMREVPPDTAAQIWKKFDDAYAQHGASPKHKKSGDPNPNMN